MNTVTVTEISTPATVGVAPNEKMDTPQLVTLVAEAMVERNKAIDSLIASETEVRRIDKELLFPALVIVRQRYRDCKTPAEKKQLIPGCKNWEGYLKYIKLSTSILRVWSFREGNKNKIGTELMRLTVEVTGRQPTTLEGNKDAFKDDDQQVPGDLTPQGKLLKQEETTQTLLEAKDVRPQVAEAEVPTPASDAASLQANSDSEMRQTKELVGKYVWLARSADAFVLVLAYDKATAEEIANLNGVVPGSCINVNVAETAVIIQGVIDKSRGVRLSLKASEVEKAIETEMFKTAAQLSADVKKPVQSATTTDESAKHVGQR